MIVWQRYSPVQRTMIDLATYRFRVGVFDGNTFAKHIKHLNRRSSTGGIFNLFDRRIDFSLCLYIFYSLLICHLSFLTLTCVGAPGGAWSSPNIDFRAQVPCISPATVYCGYF